VFRDQTSLLLAATSRAMENRDHREIAFHIHRLRGSLGILASPALTSRAGQLEGLALAGDWERIPPAWEHLRTDLRALDRELDAFLGSPPPDPSQVPARL